MKKLLAAALSLAIAIPTATALAAPSAEINSVLDESLRSLMDASTRAQFEVANIRADDARVLEATLKGRYEKTGSKNAVALVLENAHYVYGDGAAPTTQATGHLALDLTKTFPRFQINLLVPQLDSLLAIMARQYAKRYGNAVTIKIKTAEKKKDAGGNWAEVKGSASFSIDMNKLPAGVAADSILYRAGTVNLDVKVNEGMRFAATLESNPAYRGFAADGDGLREKFAKLAGRDAATIKDLGDLYRRIDKNVGPIVEATVSPF